MMHLTISPSAQRLGWMALVKRSTRAGLALLSCPMYDSIVIKSWVDTQANLPNGQGGSPEKADVAPCEQPNVSTLLPKGFFMDVAPI